MSVFSRLLDAFTPARRALRVQAAESARLEAFLRASPVEYCGWDQAGGQAVSRGFCALLGIERVTGIEDVQAALAPGDAAALEGLFNRLQQYGEIFDLNALSAHGRRTLKISGKRGATEDGAELFSVLWVADITDYAQAASRGMEAVSLVEKREGDLRAALNALPFPVWMRDQRFDLAWCNKAYARMVEGTSAGVVAEQKELPFKGEVADRLLAQRAAAKQDAISSRGHVIAGGQRRLMELIEIPFSADPKLVGVGLDVTREEEWESAYKKLAASHTEALEQLRTAIAMFDAETKLEFYNSAYEQLTGMSGVWLNTRPRLVEIVDKLRELRKVPEQADYKQYKQAWLDRFTGLLEPMEEMQYLPDGTVLRAVVVPRPMGGLMLTMEDVTSRLQLETSYNTLMAVQQETMDNLAEGIAVFGEDGRLRLANKSFRALWNLEGAPTTHISKMADAMAALFENADAKRIILGNALEREPRRGRFTRKDGIVVEFSVVPLPDGNILNAYADVTAAVKVEQALREKNAALEEAERLKTNFLANVSYQLRTPLNAMMGFAEMLNQQYFGKLNERQLEYTGSVLEAGQRLISLVNDILDLSTIEAGYMELQPEDVNVKEMLSRVAALTTEWARKQGIQIFVECKDHALSIEADPRRVKQVLLNLVSNAFNYSPSGGTVTLSAQRVDDFVEIGVRDTGVGIAAADLSRVFTPFDRIESKRAQQRSGAGLGLALVKNIVELHGGSVKIESTEGEGTFVLCRLPMKL